MDNKAKNELLYASLERAAEQLGDITPHVMDRYYAILPEARRHFRELHEWNQGALEGAMVEQTLYCLMEWFECPGEVEIILLTTVPHHLDTLDVPAELFAGLIDAVCETVVSTIPEQAVDELGVWDELLKAMHGLVDREVTYARKYRTRVTAAAT